MRSSSSRPLSTVGLAICLLWAPVTIASFAIAACSSSASGPASPSDSGGPETSAPSGADETPISGISAELATAFENGRTAFNANFGETDGLGPLYTETSCGKCHTKAERGPGFAQKMAIVENDQITPAADQSLLPYGNTVHPQIVGNIPGVHTPILAPIDDGGLGQDDAGVLHIRVSKRLGPPLYGRGYMEAVADTEIERLETEQATRTDGIHGRANHLAFASEPNPDHTYDNYKTGDMVIGRFGLKARIATLDDFAADALQGDVGITSPMRPTEFKNPDGVLDDLKVGVDVTADQMNARGDYARLLAIPPRGSGLDAGDASVASGKAWFESCTCNVCHAETMKTRPDYPVPQIANIDAPIFTDLLLHDMGDDLADSVIGGNEGQAGPRDWRTTPLMGLRYNTTYLHDGRATTLNDAVLDHGGNGSEAARAVTCYKSLNSLNLQSLLDYLGGL